MKRALAVVVMALLLPLVQVSSSLALSQSSSSYRPTYIHEDSQLIYVGNGFLELQFQKNHGGIYSIINKMTGEDYRSNKQIGAVLFSFSGPASLTGDSNGASSFTYSYSTNDSTSILTLNYAYLGTGPATITTTVRVIRNSSLSFWRISATNPSKTVLDEFLFPRIDGIAQVGNQTAGNYLLLGDGYGTMLTDLFTSFVTKQFQVSIPGIGADYPSIIGDLQLMVVGNPFGGLYLSTYDTNGNPKEFDAWKDTGSSTTINLAIVHHLPELANSTIILPYDTVVGVYKGDWYAAANMYRSWAMKQWWTAQGPLSQRSDVPSWFKRGFVATSIQSYNSYNVSYPYVIPSYDLANFSQVAVRLAQILSKWNSPVLVDWRGWERYGAWDAPDVFPPHEGWGLFNDTIAKIHAMGQRVIVSLSADDIFPNDPGFDKTWLDCSVRNLGGTVLYDNGGGLHMAFQSAACSRFQDWLVNSVTTLARSGVDGVRLDSNFNWESLRDYNGSANHPPGYGTWLASSWVDIFTRIKAAVSPINPHFVLGSEGLPEMFIPWNEVYTDRVGDIGFNSFYLGQFGGAVKHVGIFEYVYSGYAVGLSDEIWGGGLPNPSSSYTTYREFTQSLEITLGSVVDDAGILFVPVNSSLSRSLAWGSSFFSRDFAPFGTRLPSPTPDVPNINVVISGDGLDGRLMRYPTPAVLSGAWLSQDGRLGYLFVNIDQVAHSFAFAANTTYLAKGSGFELLSLNENTRGVVPFDPTKPTISVNLPPKEILVVEVSPLSAVSRILWEYDAFKGSYISGMAIFDAQSSSGLNFDAAQSILLTAEGAYISQNISQSVVLSLRALNTTAQTFGRFGQLLSDQQTYLNYLTGFNSAAKSGNYSGAFDWALSAIHLGTTSAESLFPPSLSGPGRTLLVEQSAYPKGHVDVGSAQALSFRVVRSYDGSYPAGALLTLNDSSTVVASNGWANFTVSQKYAGKGAFLPSGGSDASGSLRILAANRSPVSVIWDEVVIALSTTSTRIPVGSNATVTWTGTYAYDKSPFNGRIVLNDTTRKTLPGTFAYTVGKVLDDKYSLTVFVSNAVSVEFVSPQTSTTTTSSTAAGGIPEFPYQYLVVAALTTVIVATYALVRRRS